jgi:hypothetical protein
LAVTGTARIVLSRERFPQSLKSTSFGHDIGRDSQTFFFHLSAKETHARPSHPMRPPLETSLPGPFPCSSQWRFPGASAASEEPHKIWTKDPELKSSCARPGPRGAGWHRGVTSQHPFPGSDDTRVPTPRGGPIRTWPAAPSRAARAPPGTGTGSSSRRSVASGAAPWGARPGAGIPEPGARWRRGRGDGDRDGRGVTGRAVRITPRPAVGTRAARLPRELFPLSFNSPGAARAHASCDAHGCPLGSERAPGAPQNPGGDRWAAGVCCAWPNPTVLLIGFSAKEMVSHNTRFVKVFLFFQTSSPWTLLGEKKKATACEFYNCYITRDLFL